MTNEEKENKEILETWRKTCGETYDEGHVILYLPTEKNYLELIATARKKEREIWSELFQDLTLIFTNTDDIDVIDVSRKFLLRILEFIKGKEKQPAIEGREDK